MEVVKNIEDLSNSIINKNKVKFDYWKYCIEGDKIGRKIVSRPVVSPFAILYDKQQFYMVGIKEGNDEFFHYRLDRIKNLKELDEKINIKRTEKDVEQYAENSVETFSGDETEIIAECDEFLLGEVIEKFGKKIQIKPISKNKFRFRLVANEFGFKMWAMRNLDMCTVLRPKSLIKEIKEVLEEANKRYNK